MLSNNLVSPISFWAPNLKTNKNIGYLKLGDTISTDNNFIPPTNELVVVKGDTLPPSSYTKIAQISNPTLDSLSPTQRNNYISLMTNIKNSNNTNAISAAFSNILNILPSMQDSIRANMLQKVLSNIAVYRYSSVVYGWGDFYLTNFYKYHGNVQHNTGEVMPNDDFIQNYNFLTDVTNNGSRKYSNWYSGTWKAGFIQIPNNYSSIIQTGQKDDSNNSTLITHTDNFTSSGVPYGTEYLLVLPMGFSITYKDDDTNRKITTISTNIESVDFNSVNPNSINTTISSVPQSTIQYNDGNGYTFINTIINQPISIPLNQLISSSDITTAINNAIFSIKEFVNPQLIDQFKNITSSISDYLSSVSVIYNNNVNVVRCVNPARPDEIWNFINSGKVQISVDNAFAASVADKINTINFSFDSANATNSVKPFAQFLSKLTDYVDILSTFDPKTVKDIPLVIYRPVSKTPDYVGLGDIVFGAETDLNTVNEYPTLACIPSTCVKDIRRWKSTDMVYENTSPYFAIYYNPYTGTFRTSTVRNQLPDGMVQKVISCIQGCKSVDNLIKSDQCAKQIAKKNSNIIADTPIMDTAALDEEDEYYISKIAQRDNKIGTIKDGIQLLKLRSDQTDSISKAQSRQALQSYLDNQAANINDVRGRLQQDAGHTQVNVNIPANYKIDVVKAVVKTIQNSNLPNKDDIIARIIASQNGKNKLVSKDELNAKMDDVLSHCPEINPNLIKKSVIRNLCYGCNI